MANYVILKTALAQVIKPNGNEEITGQILQDTLIAVINALGTGFQFMGVAQPDTDPGTPDQRVMYLATEAGTYSNFGTPAPVLDGNSVYIFTYADSWTATELDIATKSNLSAYLAIADLASETGQSTTTTMTQKAITTAIISLAEDIETAVEELTQAMQEHVAKLPELVVGSSAGVLGRTVDAAFLFRRTAGTAKIGRGAAAIMAILGNTEVSGGHLISNDAAAIKTVGFNQWDEKWELGDLSAGQPIPSNTNIRAKNFIDVFPDTEYYFNVVGSGNFYVCEYDSNGGYVQEGIYKNRNIAIRTTANTRKIRFSMWSDYGSTYKHDICINLSDPAKNGTYEPYWERTIQLGLSTLTGKLNGQGASVVVFPHGVCSAGDVRDEIVGNMAVKRCTIVDLSLYQEYLSYNSGFGCWLLDVQIAKCKFAGNYAVPNIIASDGTPATYYYGDKSNSCSISEAGNILIGNGSNSQKPTCVICCELATPETYILDEPLQMSYQVENGGTEQAIAPEGATLPSAPFVAQIQYPLDVIALQGDSQADMLDAMVAAGVITAYTMTYNVAAQKYEFTINGVSRNLPENNRKGGGDDEPNGDESGDEPGEEPTQPGNDEPGEPENGEPQEEHEEEAVMSGGDKEPTYEDNGSGNIQPVK